MEKKFDKELLLIGHKIKQIRLSKNMTQSNLASLCDIDTRTIQRIEKGEHNMSLRILFSLIESLETNIEVLLKV